MAGSMVPLARRMRLESFRCSSSERIQAPWARSASDTAPSISRVTTMDCSEAQMVPLSKVLESRIRFTAWPTSAERWI